MCLSNTKITKYVLIGQNATILAIVVYEVSTVSTTCFGLYIGHRQVVFSLSSNYKISVVYSGGGARSRFTIVKRDFALPTDYTALIV